MKSLKIYNLRKITIAIFALGAMASCSNDFTDRPSEDSISASNYYKNDEQVRVATDGLYYKTWFQFNNKFFYAISEVGSGNMYTNSSDVNAMRSFSITSSDAEMFSGWQSLWANVAQANYLINNLQRVADPSVSQSVINNALGEAYFMRATAYFYLVRLWGPVPIIVNNLDHVTNPQLNTNRVEDVYELVTRDYTQAISLLNSKVRGSSYADNAKVSKGSAKAMLAKVYLYLKDYTKARQLSEEVLIAENLSCLEVLLNILFKVNLLEIYLSMPIIIMKNLYLHFNGKQMLIMALVTTVIHNLVSVTEQFLHLMQLMVGFLVLLKIF